MTERLRPQPGNPCRDCPWRRDTRPACWPEAVYDRLPRYDGDIQAQINAGATGPMFCFRRPTYLCAGWVACYKPDDLLALRMHTEQVNWWLVRAYTTATPLFSSGAEAAAHGKKNGFTGGWPTAATAGMLHGSGLPRRRELLMEKDAKLDALVEDIVGAVVEWAGSDPAKLDDAARILALSKLLGPLPVKEHDETLLRPRHCEACGTCPQFRTASEGTFAEVCKCGHPVEKHSFVPYKVVYYERERSRNGPVQAPANTG